MKALKYIGIAVLIIIIAGGIAAGGYALASWNMNKNTSKNNSNNTNNTNNSSNSNNSTNAAPAKVVTATTCNADELSLTTASSAESGAGTLAFKINLTNIGSRTCTLGGYPGVSLVNDNGNQIGSPAGRVSNIAEKTVTLKTHDTVSSTVFYTDEGNYSDGTCKDGATKLRVYPPNDTGYLSVLLPSSDIAWCPKFEVTPVQ